MFTVNRWLAGTLAAAAFGTLAAVAATTSNPASIVASFENAKFIPLDPKNVGKEKDSYAVLWGDPATGPSHMLFRFGKTEGDDDPMHAHSSDYQAVVVKGIAKHWLEGKTQADATPLGPGGYWSQPAGQLHADTCLVDECLLFVTWSGKMD